MPLGGSSPLARTPTRDARRESGNEGERLAGVIYGTIVVLSVVVAGAKAYPQSPGHVVVLVRRSPTVVFWLAHVYSFSLGDTVAHGEHLSFAEVRHIARREAAMIGAAAASRSSPSCSGRSECSRRRRPTGPRSESAWSCWALRDLLVCPPRTARPARHDRRRRRESRARRDAGRSQGARRARVAAGGRRPSPDAVCSNGRDAGPGRGVRRQQGSAHRRGPGPRRQARRRARRVRPRRERQDPGLPQGQGADAGARHSASARSACTRRRSTATSAAGSGTPRRRRASARSTQPEYGYELPTIRRRRGSSRRRSPSSRSPSCRTGRRSRFRRRSPRCRTSCRRRRSQQLQDTAADLSPVDDRAAQPGDVLVLDLVMPRRRAPRLRRRARRRPARARARDGARRHGARRDERRSRFQSPRARRAPSTVTLKEIHEKVLPPLDDELARA